MTAADLRALYVRTRERLVAAGWTPDEIASLNDLLKVDLAPGPGARRDRQMTLEERRTYWRGWFCSWTGEGIPTEVSQDADDLMATGA